MEQNLKYIVETCDGVQKFIDGHLMDAVHQVDPSITNDILSDLDDWESSYEGIMDHERYDSCAVFGSEETELPPNLL